MKLDNKYFPAFMAVVAILTAITIVISSLKYKETQKERFIESIQESDSLLTQPLKLIDQGDSVSIDQFKGNDIVIVFWSSWSEKSDLLLQEMYTLSDQTDSLTVISALVLDATEDIQDAKFIDGFIHIDGASLYNELKVPGIPSYLLLDKKGNLKYAHVGYQENAGYSLLQTKIEE
ncbi:MAG: hypothetical protein JXR20_07760 [Balneola sp.]